MYVWVCCGDDAASHQLPMATAFCRLIALVAHSLILNAMATQYTRSLSSIYLLH